MAIEVEMIQDKDNTVGTQKRGFDCGKPTVHPVAGPLAGFIYHDLRLPLSSILAYSELLAEDDLGRLEREDFHREIRLAVCRMNDLISLLLELSKGLEGSRPEIADITDAIQRAVQAVAVRRDFRRIAISCHHEGLTKGLFDPGQVHQVITNLVLNACEAVSPVTGRIQVRSRGRHDCVEISVSDNGPGIPEAIRHAIFQPFVSYGKKGGTGLGLAIVQNILRDRGGDIYLDATSEEGTVLRVVLPYLSPRSNAPIISNIELGISVDKNPANPRAVSNSRASQQYLNRS
jgi:signal transduction histidine kinase